MGDAAASPPQGDAGLAGETGPSQVADNAVGAFNDLATSRENEPAGAGFGGDWSADSSETGDVDLNSSNAGGDASDTISESVQSDADFPDDAPSPTASPFMNWLRNKVESGDDVKRSEVSDWEPQTDFRNYFQFDPPRGVHGEPDIEARRKEAEKTSDAEQENLRKEAKETFDAEQEYRRRFKKPIAPIEVS